MIKVKTNTGKMHYYDKKAVYLDGGAHTDLKEMARKEGYSMGDMIELMMRQYKRFG